MIKGSITSFVSASAHLSTGTLAVGGIAVIAAVAVGFLFMFNEASYQRGAQRRATSGVMPEQKAAPKAVEATGLSTVVSFEKEQCEQQPAFAGELIAVVKDLAQRVMMGQAPVAELISMLDMMEKMGIKVKGMFNIGSSFLAPKNTEEATAKAA